MTAPRRISWREAAARFEDWLEQWETPRRKSRRLSDAVRRRVVAAVRRACRQEWHLTTYGEVLRNVWLRALRDECFHPSPLLTLVRRVAG